MLSTSLAAVVLSGVATVASATGQPSWQTDYPTALVRAAESNKPIAVFIAHGGAGYTRVVAEGGLTPDDVRQLKQNYICLYVDTDTRQGTKLSEAFAMSEGLIISDRTGEKQAFRHDGKVPQAELGKYLTRYADPTRVITTTDTPAAAVEVGTVVAQPVAQAPAPIIPAYYPPIRPAAAACSS